VVLVFPKATASFLIRYSATFYVQERSLNEIFVSFANVMDKDERLSPLQAPGHLGVYAELTAGLHVFLSSAI
jgi:hypothetical protein